MKKRLLPLSIVMFSLFIIISSCSKKSSGGPSRTEQISTGSWKFEKATTSGIDISGQVPACLKDNVITFQSNGTATIDEGPTACATPAPPTVNWEFKSNETVLGLSAVLFPGGSSDFNIVTLNSTNLVVSQTMTTGAGPLLVVVTFKH
jgi:hypothetical protein